MLAEASASYALASEPNRAAELGRKGSARNRILQAPSETAPNLHPEHAGIELGA